jgi:oxygen-independent coproporphyrinogen-3 oxidase
VLPDDDSSAAMQERVEERLAAAGYVHYETSAFAKTDKECRHNSNYWRFGDYLGIGAGAHSKLSFARKIVRQMRWKQPREYMDRTLAKRPVQQEHEVAAADVPFEFMMNALRLTAGFPAPLFEERGGVPFTAVLEPLRRAEALGLIRRSHAHVAPTRRGQRFLNDLLQLFLPEPTPG